MNEIWGSLYAYFTHISGVLSLHSFTMRTLISLFSTFIFKTSFDDIFLAVEMSFLRFLSSDTVWTMVTYFNRRYLFEKITLRISSGNKSVRNWIWWSRNIRKYSKPVEVFGFIYIPWCIFVDAFVEAGHSFYISYFCFLK